MLCASCAKKSNCYNVWNDDKVSLMRAASNFFMRSKSCKFDAPTDGPLQEPAEEVFLCDLDSMFDGNGLKPDLSALQQVDLFRRLQIRDYVANALARDTDPNGPLSITNYKPLGNTSEHAHSLPSVDERKCEDSKQDERIVSERKLLLKHTHLIKCSLCGVTIYGDDKEHSQLGLKVGLGRSWDSAKAALRKQAMVLSMIAAHLQKKERLRLMRKPLKMNKVQMCFLDRDQKGSGYGVVRRRRLSV